MALAFHLVPQSCRQTCLNQLIRLLQDNNGCLDTGFLSVGLILDVLTDNGRIDEAYKLLYQDQCPSWLYEVKNGATTIWEAWNAVKPDGTLRNCSYNHYAFGCVGDWMYRTIAGINSSEPGYRKILIRPHPDSSLKYADASVEIPYGILRIHWEKKDGKLHLAVDIPCNTRADVVLPDGSNYNTGSGHYEYECVL